MAERRGDGGDEDGAKLDFLDVPYDGHGAECCLIGDIRDVQSLTDDTEKDSGLPRGDDRDVLRFDKEGVNKVTHQATWERPFTFVWRGKENKVRVDGWRAGKKSGDEELHPNFRCQRREEELRRGWREGRSVRLPGLGFHDVRGIASAVLKVI